MRAVLITDSACDLPVSYIEENKIDVLSLSVYINGKEYMDDLGKSLSYEYLYDELRKGTMPTTSQINADAFESVFRKYAAENIPMIYIGISSVLSGCINSAYIAKDSVLSDYSYADITIVDTKSASMGEGLLVYYASEMLKEGKSKDEIIEWLEANKLKVNHWVTVDDLNHLKHGGRVSATSAAIGTLLDIKPILVVNDEGKLIPVLKARGRKKALKTFLEKFAEKALFPSINTVFIGHADCAEEAENLRKILQTAQNVKNIIVNPLGTAVAAHTGLGTLTLFFLGNNREV